MPSSRAFAVGSLALLLAAGVWALRSSESEEGEPESALPVTAGTTVDSGTGLAAADVPVLGPAPDLVELDGWLQTDIESLEQLEGKIVILQFWTFSCSNCKATIPTLQALYGMYGRDELEIVGVHAPEFSFEESPAAILEAAGDLDVSWPIALDTRKRNFHSWQEGRTAYWPRTYVIDGDGLIRFDHIGEGKYEDLRDTVAALVGDL